MNVDDVKYKIEVMQAYLDGKEIEFVENTYCAMRANNWRKCISPIFNWEVFNYRVKPEIIEKPSINWDHVSDKFNYLSVDNKGDYESAWLYEAKPEITTDSFGKQQWRVIDGEFVYASNFKSFHPGNCEPQDSLICRPGFE